MRMLIVLRLRGNTLELIFNKRSGIRCVFYGLDEWIHYNKSWGSDISGKIRIVPQFLDEKESPKVRYVFQEIKRNEPPD